MNAWVGINDFVKRQTAESQYAHFEGTWEELADMVEREVINWSHKNPNIKNGYRKGVILVAVNPDRFFSSVAELKEGDKFVSVYKARQEGEEPYIQSIYKSHKVPAQFVEIVLYSHDVLNEHNEQSTLLPWEIISINAFPDRVDSPMPPETAARNILGLKGGTDVKLCDKSKDELIQFINDLAHSIYYWNSHVQITPLEKNEVKCTKCGCVTCFDPEYVKDVKDVYSTFDCVGCGRLMLLDHGKVSDFHETMHEENKCWPKDGKGTGMLEIGEM